GAACKTFVSREPQMAAPVSFSRWLALARPSLFEYKLPRRFEKRTAIFVRFNPDHTRVRLAIGCMKSLRQRRVGLSDGLLNVLAPSVSIGLDPLLLKVGVGLFESLVRWIELNLPRNGNLAPVDLSS